jgi:hypothetical protein
MSKQLTVTDRHLTFYERLGTLRAANADAHYNAALIARTEFEDRLVRAVGARVQQVLDAITAD